MKLLGLKPVVLTTLTQSTLVVDRIRRPLLSAIAKDDPNFQYVTFPLKDGKILVLRYKLKNQKRRFRRSEAEAED